MRKIKRFFVHLICVFVTNKKTRHRLRHFLMDMESADLHRLYRFAKTPVKKPSVLVVEPNDCHGEVVPGYISYLLKLGYNIDVILNKSVYKMYPLCRMKNKNINVFATSFYAFSVLMKMKKIKQYDHIVLTSSAYYHFHDIHTKVPGVLDYVPHIKDHPSVIVVEHDILDIAFFHEEDLLNKGRLITLGKFDKGVYVNPHHFGQVNITPKNKKTNFVVVGSIVPHRKNHKILIDVMKDVLAQTSDFKVTVIGDGKLTDVPQEMRPFIDIKGRLDFKDMYDEVEKADFFLPLLDPENKDHMRYITSGVTGSAQLIYGFAKVPIIHQKFADFYGFNSRNSIIYENNFAQAMISAIQMDSKTYQNLQEELVQLANSLYDISFKNMEKCLNGC